ncbi:Thiamine biosynthesis lipoprotein ApbE precursor [compost metagenome]
MQAGGFRGDGRPWVVAIEAPVADRRDIAARLEIHNASLATSGSYRHRRLVGDRWISHTIDPRSGAPADSDLVSVTVQMPDCILADAWATALLVAGRERAEEMCRAEGLSAILIAETGRGRELVGCGSFAR